MGVLSELASRELAELLLQEPGVGRCLVAPDGRVLRANDEWLRSTGLTGETVVGADVVALFPHTRDLARALHARARLGHRVAVRRHVQRIQGRDTCWDGSIAPVPMNGGIGLLITAREVPPADTTDAAPRAAPDSAPDPPPPAAQRATFCTAVLSGPELRYTYVNAGYRHIAPDTPMLGRRFREVFPQAAAAGAEECFLRVLETGETWCIDAYRGPTPSDPEATWDGEAVRLPTPEGEPPSVAVFIVEVTDRVRLERALGRREKELRQAQDQLRKTIERISDGVLVLDRDWRCTLVSERAARIVGIPRERLLGGCVWELFPHARGTKFHEGYRRAMDTGEPVHFEEYYPAPLDMWIECHCYPSPDELTVYFRDVTDRRRTDEALRESNALLRAISDTSADAIFAKDRAGRLRFANPATLALIGKPLDAVLGRTDAEILEDRGVARTIMANDRRIMDGGERAELEEAVPLPDGTARLWWSRKVPFRDERGTVVGLLGVSRDITARKAADARLRADAERLAAVLKAQREIAALGSEGAAFLHAVLARTADLAGAEGACLEMREGEELVYAAACGLAKDFVGLRLAIARSFSGRCLTSRTVQRCDDSERDPHVDRPACRRVGLRAMVATPLRYGDDLFGVLKLMSARVGAFDAGTEHTLGLMGEFLGATIARKRAEEALREADRRKDAFLAMLGHELRNPLAPIRNSLYLLERTAPGGESTRRAHAVIDRQVTHLTRLVDDLLDVTRIARGKITLEREPLELGGLVRGTLEDYRETFAQSRLALTLALPEEALWVSADRTRLAQVIGNLLGNAAKFTPPGGRVSVSLDGDDGHSGQALLRVCDTGIGIAPELLARVFEPFAQADTTLERSRGGLGLGLATVKGLVELHGGRVGVQSAGLGAGTELTVQLPLARFERPTETPPARRASAGERRHVLVIEDNRDAAESLRLLLELLGHRVDVAHAGSDGLEMARALGPELILCDIGLPGMDGYAVARSLRRDPLLQPSTLVAISGYAAPEDIAKSREAGFDAHLAKPVELTMLEGFLGAARRGKGAA